MPTLSEQTQYLIDSYIREELREPKDCLSFNDEWTAETLGRIFHELTERKLQSAETVAKIRQILFEHLLRCATRHAEIVLENQTEGGN